MKILSKSVLGAAAIAALTFTTSAQAHDRCDETYRDSRCRPQVESCEPRFYRAQRYSPPAFYGRSCDERYERPACERPSIRYGEGHFYRGDCR